ncbi:MAG: hypothetical protein WD115_03800 [Balneolaceae bacterium]
MSFKSSEQREQHRLVVLGDSLAQGFKNGGVFRSDLSFPALLARSLNPSLSFEAPSFTPRGGIPINLEHLVRGIEKKFGSDLRRRDYPRIMFHLFRVLRKSKAYWKDDEHHLGRDREIPYHNQAVWGFATNDLWLMNDQVCHKFLNEQRDRYSVFSVLPDHAMYITGRLVLNPGFREANRTRAQLDNLEELHERGGVENLILCVGHNNSVGALSALKIEYSQPDFLEKLHHDRTWTVYRPSHFREEYEVLCERVAKLGIRRVFLPTIPYLTIPPVTRGINDRSNPEHRGYFDYYTRFWIWDDEFDPGKHPHLTRDEAMELDQLVDQYNFILRDLAAKYDFHIVPVHRYVHAVARRRLGTDSVRPYPPEFTNALASRPETAHLVREDGRVQLSTDYIRIDPETNRIARGGIFGLDGLHPTTIGYGLIANIYRNVMQKEGVEFEAPMDWDWIIRNEPLVTHPPQLLRELRYLLRFFSMGRQERFAFLGQNILQQLLERVTRS